MKRGAIVENLIKEFEKHYIEVLMMESVEELHAYLKNKFHSSLKVNVGGSQTLFETGVIDLLKNSDVEFHNRYEEGADVGTVFRQAFSDDLYITSSNAITTDGYLYNIDYTGNRVAAMIYGPKEVLVICGTNKIFDSEKEAIQHIRTVSCPKNCVRLNRKTPCTKLGYCVDCESEDKLCSDYVKMGHQREYHRIKLIIIKGSYGY